mgnify:CR=1 FL=1
MCIRDRFKKDIWYNEMRSILSRVESNIGRERLDDSDRHDMILIRNETEEELAFTPAIAFDPGIIDPDNISLAATEAAREYIEKVRRYYIEVSKEAVEARDKSIMAFERADHEGFIRMKKEYTNESLEEFVRNDNEKTKIKRYKDRLYQNYDQIFQDPENMFVKAHFYAPCKRIFGACSGTLAVNTGVIWFMTAILYLLLYFRVLYRILDSSAKLKKGWKYRHRSD